MPHSNFTRNVHLYNRAGFGIKYHDIKRLMQIKPKEALQEMLKQSQPYSGDLDCASDDLLQTAKQLLELQGNGKTEEQDKTKKELSKLFRQLSRDQLKQLNLSWLDEMVNSKAILREKMSLFWHGHFACREDNYFYAQQLLNKIRKYSLADFGTLLKEVSKSAAMLKFLNNRQNRKEHPNENFAREVMELFTLGRGNYTEQDVKEAARAFTGWNSKPNGDFFVNGRVHDNDEKTFLQESGNLTGDDVLNILLKQKQTALFICQKIYCYFVNPQPNKKIIANLATLFYNSNYNIAGLMEYIFSQDWFYDEQNVAQKIKSPVELLVGLRNTLPISLANADVQLQIQKILGQVLFYPPNVAGWPGGTNWIDSSSLMMRLQIPRVLKDNLAIYLTPKSDDDVMAGMMENAKPKRKERPKLPITLHNGFGDYLQQFDEVKREDLFTCLHTLLLNQKQDVGRENVFKQDVDASSRSNYIETLTLSLMSTPEYQMC